MDPSESSSENTIIIALLSRRLIRLQRFIRSYHPFSHEPASNWDLKQSRQCLPDTPILELQRAMGFASANSRLPLPVNDKPHVPLDNGVPNRQIDNIE